MEETSAAVDRSKRALGERVDHDGLVPLARVLQAGDVAPLDHHADQTVWVHGLELAHVEVDRALPLEDAPEEHLHAAELGARLLERGAFELRVALLVDPRAVGFGEW